LGTKATVDFALMFNSGADWFQAGQLGKPLPLGSPVFAKFDQYLIMLVITCRCSGEGAVSVPKTYPISSPWRTNPLEDGSENWYT